MDQRSPLPVLSFSDRASFEQWLEAQPSDSPGAWLKIAKQGAAPPALAKSEAIDAALCHGWIDGQLDRHDESHYRIRFTPRRRGSKWSALNRDCALALIEQGRMRPRGRAPIVAARADGRWQSAYQPASRAEVPPDLAAALAASPAAKAFFASLSGANRYAILYRVGAVKRPETRARKIADFVAMLERGETIHG
jgi:uncharacterized protein YdeI (YjbR/CyaY-like superfamily)